jgi:type I restriction enzyme S subunit
MEGYIEELRKQAIGGVIKYIKLGNLTEALIELPSMEQQKKIVERLDKSRSVLNIIQQLLNELDYLIKARFLEMFGEPIANKMEWPVKTLKELSTLITNGNTPKGGSENYVESGITFLRSQNVWRNRVELDDVVYIDKITHQSMKKSSLYYKDILITKTGRINTENSSLGRAALFLGEDNSANINGHVYLVRLTDEVVPEYVVTILTGEAYRKYIRKVCVGGIDKRQINIDQVENFPIIIPPIDKQREFERFVTQVNKSKVVVQKALDKTQLLFDSLMQEYFG